MTLLVGLTHAVADIDLFRSFYSRLTATSPYKTWKQTKAGGRDAAKFEAFAQAVIAGRPVARPTVETTFGNAMLDAAQMGANG